MRTNLLDVIGDRYQSLGLMHKNFCNVIGRSLALTHLNKTSHLIVTRKEGPIELFPFIHVSYLDSIFCFVNAKNRASTF